MREVQPVVNCHTIEISSAVKVGNYIEKTACNKWENLTGKAYWITVCFSLISLLSA